MATVFNGDCAEVFVRGTLHSQRVENTLFFQRGAGWAIEDLDQLANAILTWCEEAWLAPLSNEYTLREVQAVSLQAVDSPGVTNVATVGTVGGVANASLPGNVAACISFRSTFRGRSARGRNYLCGSASAAR